MEILILLLSFLYKIQSAAFFVYFSNIQYGQVVNILTISPKLVTIWINTSSSLPSTSQFIAYSFNLTSNTNFQNSLLTFYNETYYYAKQKISPVNGVSCVLFEKIKGRVCCSQNNVLYCSTWDYTAQYSDFKGAFGLTIQQYFYAGQSTNYYQLYKCTRFYNSIIQSCTLLYKFNDEIVKQLQFYNGNIFILSYQYSNNSNAIIRILSESNYLLGLVKELSYAVSNVNNMQMRIHPRFLVLSSGFNIFVNHMYLSFSPTNNYTVDSLINHIQVSEQNIFISLSNQIRQYTFSEFVLAYTHTPYGTPVNCSLVYDWTRKILLIAFQDTLGYKIQSYNVTGGYYDYNLPFSCQPFYNILGNLCSFNQTYADTFNTTMPQSTPLINLNNNTNNTSSSNTSNQSITPSQNVTNFTNSNISIIQNSTFNMSNSNVSIQNSTLNITIPNLITNITLTNPILYCQVFENGYCLMFCKYSCAVCTISGQCLVCQPFYILDENSKCYLPSITVSLVQISLIINQFRIQSIQNMFFLINGLELYNYHKTNYSGIFKDSISFLNLIQQQIWNFLVVDQLKQVIQQRIPIQGFLPFTNERFQQIQRNDIFFLQNVKIYFIFYCPIMIVLFFILNRLFFFLFHYQLSVVLRIYSFWMSLVLIVFLQNIKILVLYSVYYLKQLTSFSHVDRYLSFISVFIIGIILILTVSYIPLSYYFYGDLSRYFVSNCKYLRDGLVYSFLRYHITPIIQSTIHVCYYDNPQSQLISLALLNLLSLSFTIYFQLFNDLFRIKLLFLNDCILQLGMVLLNVILLFGYYSELSTGYNEIIEPVILVLLSIFLSIFFVDIIYSPFKFSLVKLKQLKDQYKNKGLSFDEELMQIGKNQAKRRKRMHKDRKEKNINRLKKLNSTSISLFIKKRERNILRGNFTISHNNIIRINIDKNPRK